MYWESRVKYTEVVVSIMTILDTEFRRDLLKAFSMIWVLILSAMLMLFQCKCSSAQSLTGATGLIAIPTAETPRDREISFGLIWLNKKHLALAASEYHGIASFIRLGYLPFLEIDLRLTRLLEFQRPQAIGDRMVSIRLRLLKEKALRPSILLGAHDFMTVFGSKQNNHFNALYLAASKTIRLESFMDSIGLHLGHSTKWIKAAHHQFVGIFGGISLSLSPSVAFMLEYDTEKTNFGIRVSLFDHLQLLLALMNFDCLSGSISCKFTL